MALAEKQLTFDGQNMHESLANHGYALIPHNIPVDHFEELETLYEAFRALPDPEPETLDAMILDPDNLDRLDFTKDKQKEWHKYRTNVPRGAKPDGLTNRSLQVHALSSQRGIEIQDDPKEFYHFTPPLRVDLEKRHKEFGWGLIPTEVNKLNDHLLTIHNIAKKVMISVFANLEENLGPLMDKWITAPDFNLSPLRWLAYHKGQGEVMAEPHVDKGWFTAQLGESHEGLWVKNPKSGEWQQVKRQAEYAVVFPSWAFEQSHADSDIKATDHKVTNIPKLNEGRTIHSEDVVRNALIWFQHCDKAGFASDKVLTHTNIADQVA